ncbi:hypothetical protein [Candidatus Brocadia sinica]|uniref:hypothetical protein n=1 Tax=Candidatus Brocadia sinica TaxID=795830 RepID=UPI00138DEFBA|nr:hypothetical protein [Candidatus Brocadia sinica]NOG40867.1 hypothetical protein [Planctomycetota bacterium]
MKQAILAMEIVCTLFSFRVCNIYAYAYEYGIVAVGHKELPVRKSGHRIRFNHPYELTEDVIAKVLSNIHYREKGLFKRIRTLNVFQDKETKQLVPLIVHAFSVATPAQVVTVSSYSERLLLTDRHNYCVLFMDDRNLNIVFSHVHKFQTYNDIMSEKKKYYYTASENPLKKRRSGFWKLVPSAGQQLEPGHENWLVINLSKEIP